MNLAFIFGCARSGTSILAELIGAHPDVKSIFEAHAVWDRAGEGVDGSHRLTAVDATPVVVQPIRDWFVAQEEEGRVVVEKNPRHAVRIPFLRAVFPGARLVHVIRDGRDVACSMVPGIGGAEWEHLKPPGWRQLQQTAAGPLRCALAWKEIVEITSADLAGVSHITVRFEALIQEPLAVARRVLGHLGLAEHPEIAAFAARIQNATRDSYHAQVQDRWFRPDHQGRVGRWRENLSRAEQEQVGAVLQPLLQRLGYQ